MAELGYSKEEVHELVKSTKLFTGKDGKYAFQDESRVKQNTYGENGELQDTEKIQELLTSYGVLNTELEKLEELKINPYALEDDLVNSLTTMEDLQNLYNEGYISSKKYFDSLDVAAVRSAETLGLNKDALLEQAKYLEKNNKAVKGNYEEALQLALAYQRQTAALDDLNSNIDSYTNTLNKSKKGSQA